MGTGNTYSYDANGNMTQRVLSGVSYTLAYDAENRLVEVKKGGNVIYNFLYDGDGQRVRMEKVNTPLPSTFTFFIGNAYEDTGGSVTKYYFAGGARVAMSQGGELYYLFSDHLGSTMASLPVGGTATQQHYKPWGEVRSGSNALPTDHTYTGQYSNTGDFGLMFYNARWYDPYLNRWVQPDSIVPDSYNPLDHDRYAYSRNNPINYNDPTGHWPEWWDWFQGAVYQFTNDMTGGAVDDIALYYGVCMDCNVSAAYAEGQQAGRVASITVSTIEEVTGTATTAAALAAMPSTAGGGLVCTVVTAGLCALPAGSAVLAEGVIAAGGIAIAGSGAATMAYIRANPVQGPRFTAGNFRKNLENRTSIPAGMRNPEAHHVLPQALETQFSRLGININEPQWGAWVEGRPHQRWSHAYQVEWESWLQNNPNVSLADVKAQAGNLSQQFGYTWP